MLLLILFNVLKYRGLFWLMDLARRKGEVKVSEKAQ